jgi:hypothetical protein
LAHTGHGAHRGVLQGATILWGAPTFDQARVAWGECERAAGGVAKFSQSRMEITYPTGGRLIFRSLDNPDNARGHTADGVVIDEAGFVDERAWYEVIRPMISDTGGWAVLMGTPKGHNWFWREHMRAAEQPDTIALQGPTLGVRIVDGVLERHPHPLENPEFPFAEAQRMFGLMPQRTFEQEFLARFVDDAGLVFRNVEMQSTLEPQPQPVEGHTYIMGVDWGKSNDWTCLSVLDVTTHQQAALDRFNQIDYRFQAGRVRVMAERFGVELIIAETNSMGDAVIERLREDGLPVQGFTTTAASKTLAIESLALAIERGQLALLHNETQRMELESYDMERLPSGAFRYGAPPGMHDDTVMALAMAWQGIGDTGPLLLWGDA